MTVEFGLSDLKYAEINATAEAGENTVVAAVAGKSIVVLGYVLTVNAEGTAEFKDATASRALVNIAKAGTASYNGGLACPAFRCDVGKALVVKTGAAQKAFGHVTYLLD